MIEAADAQLTMGITARARVVGMEVRVTCESIVFHELRHVAHPVGLMRQVRDGSCTDSTVRSSLATLTVVVA